MDDFPKTLIIAIVVCAVAVVLTLGIIYYIATHWSRWVHRNTPDPWAMPESEKTAWPKERKSSESIFSSPVASPRSSRFSNEPMISSYNDEPVTPPRKARV